MKLLLDETLSYRIAEGLRRQGHDVNAVDEQSDLRGLPDLAVVEVAQLEGRAIATYNRDDFLVLDGQFRGEGREHHGIIVINPRRFPPGAATTRALTTSLETLLETGSPYPGFVHWLQ